MNWKVALLRVKAKMLNLEATTLTALLMVDSDDQSTLRKYVFLLTLYFIILEHIAYVGHYTISNMWSIM